MSETDNLTIWEQVQQPPATALKEIKGGRLSGMSDINPMWRIEKLTELFGVVGFGWKYEIVELWTEEGKPLEGPMCREIIANARINLFVKIDGEWSEPIPGIGGNKLIEKEYEGAYTNDEGFKMAITDALSVACKELGFGADIYYGRWDGSKYNRPVDDDMTADWMRACKKAAKDLDREEFKNWWPTQKETIISACGKPEAGKVHKKFLELLAEKGSE